MNKRSCTNEVALILSKKELQQLEALTKNWKVPICKLTLAEIYVKLRQEIPKYICNTVAPEDSWDHFDNYLMNIAKSNAKEMEGLESTNFQLHMINNLNGNNDKKGSRKKIKKVLKQISQEKSSSDLCAFANSYRNFQLDYMLETACEDGVLFKGRNESWMEKLPDLLKQHNCFVALGLGHLMMDCGLIVSLRNEGFIVETIIIDK